VNGLNKAGEHISGGFSRLADEIRGYGRRFKDVGDYVVVKRAIEGDLARYH
jgi:hypothetical protein